MPIELNTPDALEYHFYQFRNGMCQFRVRAPNDAHLALTGEPNETHPIAEVFIGGWQNSKSVIRYNQTKPEVAEANTPQILSPNEFRGFWIRVIDNVITVGREGEAAPFLSWHNPQPFLVNYVGVCTGWGASGSWIIDDPQPDYGWQGSQGTQGISSQLRSDFAGQGGGSPCWVPASNGEVPPDAVEGGTDGEPQFVARARHEGDLIPGKLVPSHNVTYVSFGGGEHPHSDYEVLVGCRPHWIQVEGDKIPPNAVPAGETAQGEPLFIGRVHHEGAVTIGKVQPSHGACYIPYGGQELAFQAYEILTC
ncbi:uncharacterized protein LOC129567635 [Sitodiplosis mosellana]|uniref:Farnesoic acid methyltransferase n=1 Tax=Sitodiplosis mosellana TaxID=263140 RepID=A0A2Z5D856_9DIPT|nr:uncharacterized protein LOC129567635 [Sitodiplosis mosellana]AXB38857.1 farnesoic acid methyltransferase [Sitodiplosis mosellana]